MHVFCTLGFSEPSKIINKCVLPLDMVWEIILKGFEGQSTTRVLGIEFQIDLQIGNVKYFGRDLEELARYRHAWDELARDFLIYG